MKDIFCPGCNHHLNAATPVGCTGQPEPGDISACLYCGTALVYVVDGDVRRMTDEERDRLSADERVMLSSAMTVAAIYTAKYGRDNKKEEKKK